MSHPVVIRTAKLTSLAAVRGSGRHTWRERDTPNADPSRTSKNIDLRPVRNSDELVNAVSARIELATEKAKDPVLCLEYLITAKSEAFIEHGGKVDADGYFRDALAWLEKRHGGENIIAVNVQRDETAPHLVVYAVPLVETAEGIRRRSVIAGTNEDGTKRREIREFVRPASIRLSAAHFQGSPAKLRALQSDFAASVGAQHGLVRGIENSSANHVTIKKWYGQQADQEAKLVAAEQRAEKLLRGSHVLARELAQHAPDRAKALGLVKEPKQEQKQRNDSSSMSM